MYTDRPLRIAVSNVQEDFLEVMKTYPESFKAMDLVAEHRLRSLHKSQAWQCRQQSCNETHLGSIIEQILHVSMLSSLRNSPFFTSKAE